MIKLSNLIEKLRKIKEKRGDLTISTVDIYIVDKIDKRGIQTSNLILDDEEK